MDHEGGDGEGRDEEADADHDHDLAYVSVAKKRVLIFHTWECNINCHRALSPMSFLRLRKTTMTAMRMISEGMMPPVVDVHHIRKCWREEGELIFSTTFPYSKRGEVKFHIHCQQPSSRQGSIWHTFPVSGC